jgi:hypothetical protein
MRFCETNPNYDGAFSDVTSHVCEICIGVVQNSIRVRLAKPNPFATKMATAYLLAARVEDGIVDSWWSPALE